MSDNQETTDFSGATSGNSENAAPERTQARPDGGLDEVVEEPREKSDANDTTSGGGDSGDGGRGNGETREVKPKRVWPAILLALIALIVALAGIAGGVYLWRYGGLSSQQLTRQVSNVQERMQQQVKDVRQDVNRQIKDVRRDLARQAKTIQRYGQSVVKIQKLAHTQKQLSQSVQSHEKVLSKLKKQSTQMQKRVEQLSEQVSGARRTILVGQIKSLLRMANRILSLREDVSGAIRALELAKQRLKQLSDPSLIGVRKLVSKEIAALQSVPALDIAGMAITLTSLSQRVPKLPMDKEVPKAYEPSGKAASGKNQGASTGKVSDGMQKASGEQQWWRRAWETVAESFSKLFSFRRADKPVQPLLPPKETYFLYQNLQLKLASARLALLQGHNQVFSHSISTAREWLLTYFDSDAPEVQAVAKKLKNLQKTDIERELPDISASLELLRKKASAMEAGK